MPSEELKSVKKEENNDDEDDDKPLALAKRNYNIKKEPKVVVKKEQNEFDEEEEDDDDHKPISLTKKKTPITKAMKESTKLKKELSDEDDHKPLAKTRKTSSTKVTREVKKKKVKKEIKKVRGSGSAEQKKKERKVYDLPGQKRDQPDEKDPLRIFYESLNRQVPNCEMAQIWLMESGLLPKDVAMEVYEKKQKKSMQQKVTSPVKAATVVKRSTKSVTVKRKTETSVKKKTTNSTSKLSKKRKSNCMSSEDEGDSDYGTGSKTAKRRKAA